MSREMDARKALDYPNQPNDKFVIWSSNGVKWPEAHRVLQYIDARRRDIMNGFALFTMHSEVAAVFDSYEEAELFMVRDNAKRKHPLTDLHITTVADLKIACGYETIPEPGPMQQPEDPDNGFSL